MKLVLDMRWRAERFRNQYIRAERIQVYEIWKLNGFECNAHRILGRILSQLKRWSKCKKKF